MNIYFTMNGIIPSLKKEYEEKVRFIVREHIVREEGNIANAAISLGVPRTSLMMYLRREEELWALARKLKRESL